MMIILINFYSLYKTSRESNIEYIEKSILLTGFRNPRWYIISVPWHLKFPNICNPRILYIGGINNNKYISKIANLGDALVVKIRKLSM